MGNEKGASPTTLNKTNAYVNNRGKRGGPISGTCEGGSDWSVGDEADSIALPYVKNVVPHVISVAAGPEGGARRQPTHAAGTHALAVSPIDVERGVFLLAVKPMWVPAKTGHAVQLGIRKLGATGDVPSTEYSPPSSTTPSSTNNNKNKNK